MRRPLRLLSAAAVVAVLGAGCGDDDDTPTPGTVENQPEVDGGETPDDTTAPDGEDGGATSGGGTQGNVEPDTPGEQGTTQSTARGGAG